MRPTKHAVFVAAFLLLAAGAPFVTDAAGICPAITAAAEEIPSITESGNLSDTVSWQLDSAGTITVTGYGDMSDVTGTLSSYSRKIKKAIICNADSEHTLTAISASLFSHCGALTEVTLPDTVTTIGNSAFYNCSALKTCNFPAELTKIGEYAFYNTALTEITLPGCALGPYAFSHCSSLKTVSITDGTEIIPADCFSHSFALESVWLPDTVKRIEATWDHGPFYNCTALKNVSIGKDIEYIFSDAFHTRGEGLTVTFREGVTAIPDDSFTGRSELATIVLPKTLTSIGVNAFKNCNKLSTCLFPDSLKQIGDFAFYNTGLTNITLPGCALSTNCFSHCASLNAVTINNGTEIIPADCFSHNFELESVWLPDSVKLIESSAWDHGAFYNSYSLKKVSIGKDIEYIHKDAFYTRGEGLEVTFRKGVTAVPESAFDGREELTTVVLPETLTSVGAYAFRNCNKLSTCLFPDSLQQIGEFAFNSTGLTDVSLPGCTLGTYAFCSCSSLKTVKINNGTEIIPADCFSHCFKLESVRLPDSVKRIESSAWDHGAFYNSSNLKNVSIGKDIEYIHEDAFYTRGSVLEVTFRKGVTAIPENSFNGRGELKKVVLPETLISIGATAFANCPNLSTCLFPDSLQEIGASAFYGSGLTDIKLPGCALGTYAFSHSQLLKTVTINNGTEIIPEDCFSHCYRLESVWLPDTVKRIESTAWDHGAFYNCEKLKNVSIGKDIEYIHSESFRTKGNALEITFREGVTAIPESSFSDRTELIKVVLPETLTSVGANAFSNCANLRTCLFPDSIQQIGEYAFYHTALTSLTLPGCTIDIGAFSHSNYLKSITIKEGTEIIPADCFSHCYVLESIWLPDSVKRIESSAWDHGAFYNCGQLNSVSIGKDIEYIHSEAFRTRGNALAVTFREGITAIPEHGFDSAPLTTLVLPESLTEISESAISGCSSLQQITIVSKDCEIADSERTIPSGARICGMAGSTAQAYAETYGRIFKVLGDEDLIIAYGNCVTGVSLTLDGRLGVNFYVRLSSQAAKVILTGPGGTVEYSADSLTAARQPDGSYKFTYSVNAAQAGDAISLIVCDERGRKLDIYNSNFEKDSDREIVYSVNDYIADAPKYENDEKLKAMVLALDQYCKAAENYFCHTEHILNIPDANVIKTNNFNKQFKISLVLNSGTALRIYSDAETAVRIKDETEIPLEAVRVNETMQYYEIPDISAFYLLENETIVLDGVTYTVCPMDYCALILAKDDSSEALQTVCSALYYYGLAAQEYHTNTEQ